MLLRLLLFSGTILLTLPTLAQKSNDGKSAPSQNIVSVGDPKLPNPLVPYAELTDKSLAEGASLKETAACKVLEPWEPVLITASQWRTLHSKLEQPASPVGVFAVVASENCVQIGRPVQLAELHRESGLTMHLGWFMPTGLSKSRPNLKAQESKLLVAAGLFGKPDAAVFVSGRLIAATKSRPSSYYSPRMLGVRMLSREQMEAAIGRGDQIIDVRSKNQFDLAHVKGAVHVPYTVGPRMNIFDSYSNYAKAGDAFDIRRIDSNRDRPVILIGEGIDSHNVFRAAVVLRSEGWKKIYLFYEGFNYFARMVWTPPVQSNLVMIVSDPNRVVQLMNDKAIGLRVYDVRSKEEFSKGSISGSQNSPMRENEDFRWRRQGLSGEVLSARGDSWSPTEDLAKTSAIMIVGQDERDWRAYKAALLAKSAGYVSVYWFNGGIDAWFANALRKPEEFPVTR